MFQYLLTLALSCLALPQAGPAQQLVHVDTQEIIESSGIANSLNDPGLAWTHNDSGGPPRLYCFEKSSGELVGKFELRGATNIDWEDLCSFSLAGKNYLAVADVGDNSRQRSNLEILIVEEPVAERASKLRPMAIEPKLVLTVKYPFDAKDCEAIAFDAKHSRLVLLTKELLTCRVVEIPIDDSMLAGTKKNSRSVSARQTQVFAFSMITAADICKQTGRLAICNYGSAYLLPPHKDDSKLWDSKSMLRIPAPNRKQGEAIAFADSNHLLLTSESAPMPLWTVEIKDTEVPGTSVR
jgi:hypothetical protein